MVLLTLLDLSVQTTVWTVKNIFYAGRYMIYGKQKTESEQKTEEMEKRLQQILDNESKLLHNLEEVKHELDEIYQKDSSIKKHHRRESI